MTIKELTPKKALNKAFLKVKPNRTEIEGFKANLIALLDRTNDTEGEEFHKNLVSDFLKDTYYKQNHFINTKGRNDLVIHNGANASSTVGVILEAKKLSNKSEMISAGNLNRKAFQELVLYYLRERITLKNLEVKHLVATNINEWFIFDATVFDRLFAQNKTLVKQFTDFEGGRLADTKTEFFYKQIAEPFIESISSEIEYTYFNLHDYQRPLRNANKADDNTLVALFKLLSPEHLLKLPFTNDSNSLDKRFYSELLHIIGLTETKEGSKKLIERNKPGERNTGSILEDAIIQLDSLDKLSRLEKPNQFGSNTQERLFNVALELSITWINRILFLKLLEAQLITYHKGDKSYAFLNLEKIKNYDDLNSLFFQVLARKHDERNEDVQKAFEKVPYLNSSLFEPTDIEQLTLFISNLRDDKTIPIISSTVLKNDQGKKRSGTLSTLEYLFAFLDAYDFSSEGSEEIQEDNKTLINASVLGLIFEKINGYKDGSFFTPGFITMYMCRETIRKAVVQKFNEAAAPLLKRAGDLSSPLLRGVGGVSTPDIQGAGDLSSPLSRGVGGVSTPDIQGTGGVSKSFGNMSRRQIIPYNPALKELARELRNNSTKSEIILWKELKGKFEGKYDFHRQKPLDNYIADFFCHELNLVIEIDGETHNWEETQQKDFEKESRLNELGLNVLRFPDSDVFKHLEPTLETIKQYIHCFESGDYSELKYDDSPLNPLTGNVVEINTPPAPLKRGDNTPLNPLSRDNTPLNPLSRDNTPLNPLSRGDFGEGASMEVFKSLDDVYEHIGDGRMFSRQQANDIVNSLKICDPAVGSGHFLVSALNEMIAVKNDLKILQDRDGRRLKEYVVEVVNDELIVTDEEGELFEYKPLNPLSRDNTPLNPLSRGDYRVSESQRIQETLFHEKQTIIENCLFGVDINANSVKICRLRLWIELLKNAYYIHTPGPSQEGSFRELQTLPNIDINIKCGNSLVSRFPINEPINHGMNRGKKWTIDSYRLAVATYRNAESKEQKREMERLIADIKTDFRSEISRNDPKVRRLQKMEYEYSVLVAPNIFREDAAQYGNRDNKKKAKEREEKLWADILKLRAEIEAIKSNKIFENAFEWRFEFPEVLNDDGDFVGFDVVIGNPPYIYRNFDFSQLKEYFKTSYLSNEGNFDLYKFFIERLVTISKENGYSSYIVPNTFLSAKTYSKLRNLIVRSFVVKEIYDLGLDVFEGVTVENVMFIFQKAQDTNENTEIKIQRNRGNKIDIPEEKYELNLPRVLSAEKAFNIYLKNDVNDFILKLRENSVKLGDVAYCTVGINTGYIKSHMTAREKLDSSYHKMLNGKEIGVYSINWAGDWIKYDKEFVDSFGELGRALPPEYIFYKEKILVQRTRRGMKRKLVCAYDNEKYYNLNRISNIVVQDNTYSTKFLISLLNSKLLDYYFNKVFNEYEVKPLHLAQLPIKISKPKMQTSFVDLVDEILKLKLHNQLADTIELENQIDQLVYQLYGLTEEEIKIVEGN